MRYEREIPLNEPVVGFRTWKYNPAFPDLLFPQSVSGGVGRDPTELAWRPGITRATHARTWLRTSWCRFNRDLAPQHKCSCGLHADTRVSGIAGTITSHTSLYGAVLLWGKLFAGATRIRARYGKVLALAYPERIPGYLIGIRESYEAVAKIFDVPVIPFAGLEAYATEHGKLIDIEGIQFRLDMSKKGR